MSSTYTIPYKTGSMPRYPWIWRLLHWTSAVVILWAIFSGFYLAFFNSSDDIKHTMADFNIAVTMVFIPVFMLRMWVAKHYQKPYTPQLTEQQSNAANQAHKFIYWVVCLELASGILMMDRQINIFEWVSFSAPLLNVEFFSIAATDIFFMVHRVCSFLLTFLIVLHVGAVIKHHRNGIPLLKKML